MGRYTRRIVALVLSPFLSKMLNVWTRLLFMEALDVDIQMYLWELLDLEKRLDFLIIGSLVLSIILFDRALSKATGDRVNEMTPIIVIINPSNPQPTGLASPCIPSNPQSTGLASPCIPSNPQPTGLASPCLPSNPQPTGVASPCLSMPQINFGSLSKETEEAFGDIAKANQDTAIASTSTSISHTQSFDTSRADSLIGSWLEGPTLSPESPSLLDQLLRNSTPKKTRRGDFDWRFSPMKEPSDFERAKRQWWGSKAGTTRATEPLRQQSSEPEDQSTDLILAPLSGPASLGHEQDKEALARRSELVETPLINRPRPKHSRIPRKVPTNRTL